MGHSRSLFLYFCLFYFTIGRQNFAGVWIWTADLWCWKRPLYQLSHNHCPNSLLANSLFGHFKVTSVLPFSAKGYSIQKSSLIDWVKNSSLRRNLCDRNSSSKILAFIFKSLWRVSSLLCRLNQRHCCTLSAWWEISLQKFNKNKQLLKNPCWKAKRIPLIDKSR